MRYSYSMSNPFLIKHEPCVISRREGEIIISHCGLSSSYTERKNELSSDGFECDCPACRCKDHGEPDRRAQATSSERLDGRPQWLHSPELPDGYLPERGMKQIRELEAERMESDRRR